MPFLSPGKRRESTNWTAKQYTEAIRKYLEAKGYSMFHDASLEGTFADMVFYPTTSTRVKSNIWVEAKYSEISIENSDLRREIIKYLEEWLKLTPVKRYTFYLFIKRARSPKKWEKLNKFTDKEFIRGWLEKSIEISQNEYVDEALKTRFDEIGEFFITSYFVDIDIPELTSLTRDIEGESVLSSRRAAEKDLKSMEIRINLGTKRDKLFANMLKLNLPESYAIIEYDNILKDYLDLNRYDLPPYANISSNKIVTINEPNILDRFEVLKATYKIIPLEQMEEDHPLPLSFLNNQALGRFFVSKGAKPVEDKKLYFFPLDDKFSPIKIEGINKKPVQVSKPLFQKNETENTEYPIEKGIFETKEKILNFGFHKAFRIRTMKIWDDYYVSITIKKLYTKDGKTPVDSDHARRIDKYFRNTKYNTSDSYKSVALSLLNLLKISKDRDKYEDGIFSYYGVGNILELPTLSSPVTIEQNQNVLELEFDESQDDDL